MKATIAVLLVFIGCMTNVIFLEMLIKEDPGSGNLITFSQFLFIAVEGYIFTSKLGRVKPHIRKKNYLVVTTLFFIVNLLNNYAFNFNVPVPLHIIFRSGSLLANMILGVYILKKSYPLSKYFSVMLIVSGITICTIVSGKDVKSSNMKELSTTPYEDFFWWTVGITILSIALLLSAGLGIYQESIYKQYGKHPKEALFYTHLLPLPMFLLVSQNIYSHAKLAFQSEPIILYIFKIPISIFYLCLNVLTQFICISSVYVLTTECSSLIVTLVLTLRKFVSLLFSIFYFKNPFTPYHWLGTVLVLLGTILFTELHKKFIETIPKKKLK